MSPPSVTGLSTGSGILWAQPFEEVLGFGPDGPGAQVELQRILNTGFHFFFLIPPASSVSILAHHKPFTESITSVWVMLGI